MKLQPPLVHKTEHFTSEQREQATGNAITQENEILKILNHPGRRYGASYLHEVIGLRRPSWPLTSIRRALTNLEKRGLVRKCEEVTVGAYGRNEHLWELVK
jgi:Fe2+ or Zn2+ uptake regulation protein